LIDKQIGKLLRALKSRGLLENTIIIVTSDHGELFGEHGLFGHGNCLYRPVLQVRLLISYPSVLPIGARVSAPVSLREIPATVMELIGVRESRTFPGSSLSRYWQSAGKEEGDSAFLLSEITSPSRIPPDHGRSPVSEGPMKALVLGGKQYIKNYGSGVEELYDFFLDPGEVSDLAHAAEFQYDLQQSRRALAQLLSH
jgi:arylsulfatase A-like enzyme